MLEEVLATQPLLLGSLLGRRALMLASYPVGYFS